MILLIVLDRFRAAMDQSGLVIINGPEVECD